MSTRLCTAPQQRTLWLPLWLPLWPHADPQHQHLSNACVPHAVMVGGNDGPPHFELAAQHDTVGHPHEVVREKPANLVTFHVSGRLLV